MSMTNEERAVKNVERQLGEERERVRQLEVEAALLHLEVVRTNDSAPALKFFKTQKQIGDALDRVGFLERCLAEAIKDMEKDKLARAKAKARDKNQREASKMQASMMRQFE